MKTTFASGLGMALATLRSLAAHGADSRPNILFIMPDNHTWQAISAYGDEWHLIQTPNLDRLAAQGMKFDHCLVNNSLCGPSRAAFLAGTYSHINGMPVMDYWELFDRQQDPNEMKSVYDDPAYAAVQKQLLEELKRQRKKFKEPATDDPKAYGYPAQFPPYL